MKPPPLIRIGNLRVRVPGTSREDGYALAERLCERLGNLPAPSAHAHIGALRLRIQSHSGLDASAISDSIATAISSKLARHQAPFHA